MKCHTVLLSLIASLVSTAAMAEGISCSERGMLSNFETGKAAAGFAAEQMQGGVSERVSDPAASNNSAVRLTAGGKGRRVGKAALIHRFPPVGKGAVVEMGARMFFPAGAALDSVILMDLECASCGLDTNPGIRLYLRDARLRVDRSKIGLSDPFYPEVDVQLEHGRWHALRWQVTIGEDEAGYSEVYLDGRRISAARGTTVLTQTIVSSLADIKVREQVDRFQVGLTANSNRRQTEMLLDDVWFCQR